MKDIKEQVQKLIAARDRTGKKPLTAKERSQILNEIYDGLLFLWKQSVITGNSKGTGAICLQLERARLELESIEGTTRQTTGSWYGGIEIAAGEYVSDKTTDNN